MARIVLVVTIVTTLQSGATAQSSTTRQEGSQIHPAVVLYVTLIRNIDLNTPLDRPLVAGYFDLLISTAEGLAIGKDTGDDALFRRIHQERRDLRYFVNAPLDGAGRPERGQLLFARMAALLRELDSKFGGSADAGPALEALDRAARGLDVDDPLRLQPNNIENFLRMGAEVLTKMAAPK